MAINERLIHTAAEAAAAGTGNQEEGLVSHLDANDVDSYDGDGSVWYDIANHEYTPTVNPADHFNTVTYTGDGITDGQSITGVGFQPDLTIIKSRVTLSNNTGGSWMWMDSIRGENNWLRSDSDSSELTGNGIDFDLDGFTTLNDYIYNNQSNRNYVSYSFKAGGTAVSNTDGDITSSVSVNNDLGFSIVSYTGSGTSGDTVGHGLSVPPEMVIIKNRDTSNTSWGVEVKGLGGYLKLNDTSAVASSHIANIGNASTFEVLSGSWVNTNGDDYIAYCFASKRGVSKVGSYTGAGSSGNKVYTGFEPAWLMVKETSSTGNWRIMDNVRDTDNPKDLGLWANLNNAESSSSTNIVDFNGDGFTIKGSGSDVNTSGQNYIYLAFAAEKPSNLIDDTDLKLHIDIGNSSCYSGTGTTVNDLSSSNHTITTLAGVEAADFDKEVGNFLTVKENSNEGLTIADHADFDHDNGATYEGWVYLDPDGTSEETLFYRGASNGQGLRIYWHSSYGWFPRDFNSSGTEILDQNNIKTGTTGYGRGKWYHLALTLSSNSDATYKFYVNGQFIGEHTASTGSGQNSQSYDISIGNYLNGTPDLQGAIGQFRFYKTVLTEDEILQNYRFTKNDYPNGFNATLQNGASWNNGGYMVLDGANDKISIPDADVFSLDANAKTSFSVWFKDTENSSSYRVLFSKGGSNKWEYALFMYITGTNRGIGFTGYNNGASSIDARNYSSSNTWLSTNTWHHLVVTVDFAAEICKVYIDGTERASDNDFAYGAYTNTDPFIFGGRADLTSNFFQGHVNNFKLFDKVLTQTEITALKDAGYQG